MRGMRLRSMRWFGDGGVGARPLFTATTAAAFGRLFFGVRMETPERNIQECALCWQAFVQACVFTGIGVLIALGQILQTKEPVTLKVAIGRCITTGGIALVAGAALTLFPEIPFIGQVGIAAMLASLGASGLEVLVQRALNR